MDVIALHAAGFENAVATLGTALTPDQARLMAKHTKQVIISYDSDEAGQAATRKAVRMLSEVGLDVRILRMEGAKDPDEYIKKFGAEKFRTLVEGSRGKFDFLCDSVLKNHNIEIPDEKVRAAHEICELIAAIYSNVERSVYISKAAEKLSLDAKSLASDVERIRRKKQREDDGAQMRKIVSDTAGYGDRINREMVGNTKAARAEETIIGLIMLKPELFEKIKSGELELTADDFRTTFGRKVFEAMEKLEGKVDIGMLGAEFSVDEVSRISDMQRKRAELAKNDETVLTDSINSLKKEKHVAQSGDELEDAMKIIQLKKRSK